MEDEIKEYVDQKKELQSYLLSFIDSSDENDYIDLINYFEANKIEEDSHEFKLLLHLIMSIVKNHHRNPEFFPKIEKILLYFKDKIKQTFSNSDILNIFKGNSKIILFLLSNNILTADKSFVNTILSKKRIFELSNMDFNYNYRNWMEYNLIFYPEIKPFVSKVKIRSMETNLKKINRDIFTDFEKKRQIGENDTYYCELIRKDSVEEFISYASKTNLSLSGKIQPSIFETNNFLMKRQPTLIQYAAFFGSIQIVQYLLNSGVQLRPSLWIYAIHGNNAELIHILEDRHISPKSNSYLKCYLEAIKCHHNEIANYIFDNYLNEDINNNAINDQPKEKIEEEEEEDSFDDSFSYQSDDELKIKQLDDEVADCSFHYYNFAFFPNDFKCNFIEYISQYDYYKLVEILVNNQKDEINAYIKQIKIQLFE